MSSPLQVGITGGIGSGKSLICKVFQLLGVPVYDADSRARSLMSQDEELRQSITSVFGPGAYSRGGDLDRAYLASIAFSDETVLQRLNQLVHPKVGEDYTQWVSSHSDEAYLIKEAALLFESGSWKQLDFVVNIMVPEAMRIKRVLSRDPDRSEEQIRAIMDKQWSDQKRQSLAHTNIRNDETILLLPQLLSWHQQWSKSVV